jgi:hypothetical protein
VYFSIAIHFVKLDIIKGGGGPVCACRVYGKAPRTNKRPYTPNVVSAAVTKDEEPGGLDLAEMRRRAIA